MKIGNTIYVVGYLMLMIIIPDSITHCSSQMLIQAAPYIKLSILGLVRERLVERYEENASHGT